VDEKGVRLVHSVMVSGSEGSEHWEGGGSEADRDQDRTRLRSSRGTRLFKDVEEVLHDGVGEAHSRPLDPRGREKSKG
jgi:hypothetical protein